VSDRCAAIEKVKPSYGHIAKPPVMARIEQRTRTLIEGDPEMREAVETVLERAAGDRVDWVDVRDELTSGQWGRLIEQGVLTDGEDGFEIADRDAVEAALSEEGEDSSASSTSSSSTDTEAPEGTEWSKWDKGAAVVTVALFAGYSWAPMRNLIGGTMDIALDPLAQMLPFYAVVMVLALATGLYSTILQSQLMDTEKMGAYQQRMKDLQNRKKEAKEAGDDEALDRIQEEQMDAMGDQMGMFKEQFRPMVWIMFLTIPAFLWMYWKIGIGNPDMVFGSIVMPIWGDVQWKDAVLGPMQAWIIWYFVCSMGFTQIIRKGLNIDITPTGT
jgi:uncharacterized membrane protein (DUF106 family)